MAKYRILNKEELQSFEKQLVQFLIVNGIEGERWKEINETDPDLAIDLVEIFSDQILQNAYENISCLQRLTPNACYFFNYGKEKSELILIQKKDESDDSFDLSTFENFKFALSHHANKIAFSYQEKEYLKEREREVHDMIQSGCTIFDEQYWEILKAIIA